jgi:glycosyltransferase involved in cell wall biosynthesis
MKAKMLKICFVVPIPPPYGGIANWTKLMCNYITNVRADVEISIINVAPKTRQTEGRNLWDRVVTSGFWMIKQYRELNRIIRNSRPDVIHITTSGQLAVIRDILLLKTAKRKGIPTVYHIRFGRIEEIAQKNTTEWKLISKAMLLATEVMAIDNTTYNAIQQNLPTVNVVCVPNPIDISNLPEPVTSSSKIIMFLGWVIKTKGIEELLLAWEKVYKENDDWRLRIVGPAKAEYLDYLKSHYSFEGVLYEGEKSHNEAMDLLNSSEIFILPSYTEAFPNSVLEAMALSKPIIATRVGAIPDMLADDCGILIDIKNVKQIELALRDLIARRSFRKLISDNAFTKLFNEYTIEKVFERYIVEWESCKLKYS